MSDNEMLENSDNSGEEMQESDSDSSESAGDSEDDDDDTQGDDGEPDEVSESSEDESDDAGSVHAAQSSAGSSKHSTGDDEVVCPICLNPFIGQDLGNPENCSHIFCLECIVEWSKNINTCPIDRTEFKNILMKLETKGDVLKKIKVKMKRKEPEASLPEDASACEVCGRGDREDRLLLCDSCDLAYHCECLDPPLRRIPVEEWFCPPCSAVLKPKRKKASPRTRRVIPRTRVSETVRTRIQQLRTFYQDGDDDLKDEDWGSTATARPSTSGTRPVGQRKTVTRRRRRRRPTKRRKTTTLARTKKTCPRGKTRKGTRTTSATKRRGTVRRRKRYRRRKGSARSRRTKRSWFTSKPLAAPSTKRRIAERLGLCKPPPGYTMPFVKPSSNSSHGSISGTVHRIFGDPDMLMDFEEDFMGMATHQEEETASSASQSSKDDQAHSSAPSASMDILGNILAGQNLLHKHSSDITIGSDGSLKMRADRSSFSGKTEAKKAVKPEKSSERSFSVVHHHDVSSTSTNHCNTFPLKHSQRNDMHRSSSSDCKKSSVNGKSLSSGSNQDHRYREKLNHAGHSSNKATKCEKGKSLRVSFAKSPSIFTISDGRSSTEDYSVECHSSSAASRRALVSPNTSSEIADASSKTTENLNHCSVKRPSKTSVVHDYRQASSDCEPDPSSFVSYPVKKEHVSHSDGKLNHDGTASSRNINSVSSCVPVRVKEEKHDDFEIPGEVNHHSVARSIDSDASCSFISIKAEKHDDFEVSGKANNNSVGSSSNGHARKEKCDGSGVSNDSVESSGYGERFSSVLIKTEKCDNTEVSGATNNDNVAYNINSGAGCPSLHVKAENNDGVQFSPELNRDNPVDSASCDTRFSSVQVKSEKCDDSSEEDRNDSQPSRNFRHLDCTAGPGISCGSSRTFDLKSDNRSDSSHEDINKILQFIKKEKCDDTRNTNNLSNPSAVPHVHHSSSSPDPSANPKKINHSSKGSDGSGRNFRSSCDANAEDDSIKRGNSGNIKNLASNHSQATHHLHMVENIIHRDGQVLTDRQTFKDSKQRSGSLTRMPSRQEDNYVVQNSLTSDFIRNQCDSFFAAEQHSFQHVSAVHKKEKSSFKLDSSSVVNYKCNVSGEDRENNPGTVTVTVSAQISPSAESVHVPTTSEIPASTSANSGGSGSEAIPATKSHARKHTSYKEKPGVTTDKNCDDKSQNHSARHKNSAVASASNLQCGKTLHAACHVQNNGNSAIRVKSGQRNDEKHDAASSHSANCRGSATALPSNFHSEKTLHPAHQKRRRDSEDAVVKNTKKRDKKHDVKADSCSANHQGRTVASRPDCQREKALHPTFQKHRDDSEEIPVKKCKRSDSPAPACVGRDAISVKVESSLINLKADAVTDVPSNSRPQNSSFTDLKANTAVSDVPSNSRPQNSSFTDLKANNAVSDVPSNSKPQNSSFTDLKANNAVSDVPSNSRPQNSSFTDLKANNAVSDVPSNSRPQNSSFTDLKANNAVSDVPSNSRPQNSSFTDLKANNAVSDVPSNSRPQNSSFTDLKANNAVTDVPSNSRPQNSSFTDLPESDAQNLQDNVEMKGLPHGQISSASSSIRHIPVLSMPKYSGACVKKRPDRPAGRRTFSFTSDSDNDSNHVTKEAQKDDTTSSSSARDCGHVVIKQEQDADASSPAAVTSNSCGNFAACPSLAEHEVNRNTYEGAGETACVESSAEKAVKRENSTTDSNYALVKIKTEKEDAFAVCGSNSEANLICQDHSETESSDAIQRNCFAGVDLSIVKKEPLEESSADDSSASISIVYVKSEVDHDDFSSFINATETDLKRETKTERESEKINIGNSDKGVMHPPNFNRKSAKRAFSEADHVECQVIKCKQAAHDTDSKTIIRNCKEKTELPKNMKGLSRGDLTKIVETEVKTILKPYYVKREITKDMYKDIMRKSIPKILSHSDSGLDAKKIEKLVLKYVDMFKKIELWKSCSLI